MKCPICDSVMTLDNAEYEFRGRTFGHHQAWVCNNCEKVYFREESTKNITELVKKAGVWGILRVDRPPERIVTTTENATVPWPYPIASNSPTFAPISSSDQLGNYIGGYY